MSTEYSGTHKLRTRNLSIDNESQPFLSDVSRTNSECDYGRYMFYNSETSDSEPSKWEPRSQIFMSFCRKAFNAEQTNLYSDFKPPQSYHSMDKTKGGAGEEEGEGSSRPRQGSLVTVFAIWNTMLGTSLLAMPWGLEKSGLILGPLIMILLGGLCFFTAYLNVKTDSQYGIQNGEISELTRALLGPKFEVISKIFSFIILLGANVVYWILMCNFLYFSVNYIGGMAGGNTSHSGNSTAGVFCPKNDDAANAKIEVPPVFESVWHLNYTVPFFLALIIVPLLNFKSPTFFTKFNSLGTMSVMFLVLFVLVKSGMWGWNLDSTEGSLNYSPMFVTSFPATSGLLSMSYFIHNIVISVTRNNKHQENNARDVGIAYCLVITTYVTIGFFFYIGFPLGKTCIQDNFLNNFVSWDVMTVLARVFLLFQLVTVFPLVAFMLRSQAMMAFFGAPYPSRIHIIAFNAFIVSVCILFAVFFPRIGTIIRYTGALGGLVHVFALPCFLRLAVLHKAGKIPIISWIIYIAIPIYGAINLLGQFFIRDT